MDVLEAIRNRRSVREYDPRPIPDEVMTRLKDSLRLAPSACNLQPWKFVVVADPERKSAVAHAARDQEFIAQAPVIVVGVGFPEQAFKHMGGAGNSVDVDLAIALDHLTLTAAEAGLGTCWIGAFDERSLKRIIGAPAESKVVALTPLGYPARPGLIHPVEESKRRPEGDVFAYERLA